MSLLMFLEREGQDRDRARKAKLLCTFGWSGGIIAQGLILTCLLLLACITINFRGGDSHAHTFLGGGCTVHTPYTCTCPSLAMIRGEEEEEERGNVCAFFLEGREALCVCYYVRGGGIECNGQ